MTPGARDPLRVLLRPSGIQSLHGREQPMCQHGEEGSHRSRTGAYSRHYPTSTGSCCTKLPVLRLVDPFRGSRASFRRATDERPHA
jgi:hypothetical protein